jgi:hypothetical protein
VEDYGRVGKIKQNVLVFFCLRLESAKHSLGAQFFLGRIPEHTGTEKNPGTRFFVDWREIPLSLITRKHLTSMTSEEPRNEDKKKV